MGKFYLSEKIFNWDLKFVDCFIHEIHEIECPTNKNDFTFLYLVNVNLLIYMLMFVNKTILKGVLMLTKYLKYNETLKQKWQLNIRSQLITTLHDSMSEGCNLP